MTAFATGIWMLIAARFMGGAMMGLGTYSQAQPPCCRVKDRPAKRHDGQKFPDPTPQAFSLTVMRHKVRASVRSVKGAACSSWALSQTTTSPMR